MSICLLFLQFSAHLFQPRNRITHQYHIDALLSSTRRDHVATTFGIFNDSVLHKSKYFHVTEGLILDIMHDVLLR